MVATLSAQGMPCTRACRCAEPRHGRLSDRALLSDPSPAAIFRGSAPVFNTSFWFRTAQFGPEARPAARLRAAGVVANSSVGRPLRDKPQGAFSRLGPGMKLCFMPRPRSLEAAASARGSRAALGERAAAGARGRARVREDWSRQGPSYGGTSTYPHATRDPSYSTCSGSQDFAWGLGALAPLVSEAVAPAPRRVFFGLGTERQKSCLESWAYGYAVLKLSPWAPTQDSRVPAGAKKNFQSGRVLQDLFCSARRPVRPKSPDDGDSREPAGPNPALSLPRKLTSPSDGGGCRRVPDGSRQDKSEGVAEVHRRRCAWRSGLLTR